MPYRALLQLIEAITDPKRGRLHPKLRVLLCVSVAFAAWWYAEGIRSEVTVISAKVERIEDSLIRRGLVASYPSPTPAAQAWTLIGPARADER